MATNKMRPIHPGEVLREEYLVPLDMTSHALAMALHVPAPRINDIVRERRAITPDTALRLARYFDTSAQFWLNLQTAFDLRTAEAQISAQIAREVAPREADAVAA
jgi:antitoxin HigA-1